MFTSIYLDALQIHDATGFAVISLPLSTPAPRTSRLLRPRTHGEVDRTSLYPGRTLELVGEVWGSTVAVMWNNVDLLKAALDVSATHTLTFRREGRAYDESLAVQVASELSLQGDSHIRSLRYGVSLFAPDPRLYVTTTQTVTQTHPTVVSATNGGNFDTPPVIVVKGPSNAGTINVTLASGGSIALAGVPALPGGVSSQIVEIYVADRLVTYDGAPRPDLVDSSLTDWWELQPGANTVSLSGSGVSSGNTRLTVQWQDARL